ncbi:hypothetical protein B4589_005900 [Halolamina sp. CBA1230]|uniref:hypothetical protein n=1 Tax=Halolamina sp. CBA1230 TaxID=1853690 RepID=UPI00117A8722|nr:hypothetical protein [Halolamina sp. CBA1230]QKY19938.1 hypothetical protein B4589_005900 [Halolamina sp. CBA1230]
MVRSSYILNVPDDSPKEILFRNVWGINMFRFVAKILAASFLFIIGLQFIHHPNDMFRMRNWPGVEKDQEMTAGGVYMYKITGVIICLGASGFAAGTILSL